MNSRDRLIICVVAVMVAVGAMWVVVVSPKRNQANAIGAQIDAARASLVSAQGQLLSARAARSGYVQEVHSLQRLSTAIPPTDGVPELLREISALAGGHSVNFQNISLTPGSSTSAGFNTIQLSFTFTAGYVQLQNFLQAVDSLTRTDGTNVLADGRLVTFDSIGLSPLPPDSTQASVTATIYQTPSATGVTGASGTASTTSTSGATAP